MLVLVQILKQMCAVVSPARVWPGSIGQSAHTPSQEHGWTLLALNDGGANRVFV